MHVADDGLVHFTIKSGGKKKGSNFDRTYKRHADQMHNHGKHCCPVLIVMRICNQIHSRKKKGKSMREMKFTELIIKNVNKDPSSQTTRTNKFFISTKRKLQNKAHVEVLVRLQTKLKIQQPIIWHSRAMTLLDILTLHCSMHHMRSISCLKTKQRRASCCHVSVVSHVAVR